MKEKAILWRIGKIRILDISAEKTTATGLLYTLTSKDYPTGFVVYAPAFAYLNGTFYTAYFQIVDGTISFKRFNPSSTASGDANVYYYGSAAWCVD